MPGYPWVEPCLKTVRVTDALPFLSFLVICECALINDVLARPTGRLGFNLTWSTEQSIVVQSLGILNES